jgi:hypothetical protein
MAVKMQKETVCVDAIERLIDSLLGVVEVPAWRQRAG